MAKLRTFGSVVVLLLLAPLGYYVIQWVNTWSSGTKTVWAYMGLMWFSISLITAGRRLGRWILQRIRKRRRARELAERKAATEKAKAWVPEQ